MAGASSPYYLLKEEFVQRADEGCAIPPAIRARFDALDPEADEWNSAEINPIHDELMTLPEDAAQAAAEPNDLADIRALRPDGPRDFGWQPTDDDLLDRLHGAWTGRCAGCSLGKPVEGRGMARDEAGRLSGRRAIKAYLEKRGDWPLSDYFSSRDVGDGDTIGAGYCDRESISHMQPDDDIHYTLVGLGVLEDFGLDFGWDDVARYWLRRLCISGIHTAEAQAILNVQNVSCKGADPQAPGSWVRRYRNPYREWIGAQIRADGWAYACAGSPQKAAELAWRDASWTHERNGIYGEMMMAAMIAASFVESDVDRLIDIGLSEIPRACRLAHWTRRCREWMAASEDWETCMHRLEAALGEMHPVHTINNALICLIAMHYGGMDTTRTPAIAVMCGLDTDCNGATVGSMVGAIAGRRGFGGHLAGRLNDRVRAEMIGFTDVTMKSLAERHAALWQARVNRRTSGSGPSARPA